MVLKAKKVPQSIGSEIPDKGLSGSLILTTFYNMMLAFHGKHPQKITGLLLSRLGFLK